MKHTFAAAAALALLAGCTAMQPSSQAPSSSRADYPSQVPAQAPKQAPVLAQQQQQQASSQRGAQTVTVDMNLVDASGTSRPAGSVALSDSPHGLVLMPALMSLPPGAHGFHVHEKGSCAPGPDASGKTVPAGAAGGHYDPQQTKRHGLPWGDGHLGDLPALIVGSDGSAAQPLLAPRLKLADVRGKALMIHAGGDNYSDHPQPLGGGGGRIACGVIPG